MKQGLYLICPDSRVDADCLIRAVRAKAGQNAVDAFLYTFPAAMNDGEHKTVLKKLIPALQSENIAVLLKDRVEEALKSGCDGVQVGYDGTIAKLRRKIPDISLGVVCETRHEAMTAGEAGADYIAFSGGDALDNAEWWAELFTVPVVVFNPDAPCPFADFIAETVCV